MRYLELTFGIEPFSELATDILAGLLADVDFDSFQATENSLKAYIKEDLFDEKKIQLQLEQFPLPNVTLSYQQQAIPDKDWNEEWEKNFFQPIIIGGQCVVHSTFHHHVPTATYDIVINPQMAFGTGHHDTTRQMLEELLQLDLTDKSVLDMGCGTCILAIMARKLGSKSVTAIDIDEWCVRNSLENIALNHTDHIQVYQGDADSISDKGPFDLVIANINRNILLRDMPRYVTRLNWGGRLYMSGFYVEDIPLLREKAESLGLTFVKQRFSNNWAVTVFSKE